MEYWHIVFVGEPGAGYSVLVHGESKEDAERRARDRVRVELHGEAREIKSAKRMAV